MNNTKQPIKAGSIITKNGSVYQTRDTLNALRLLKLAQAMEQWKLQNSGSQVPSVQRKVKAIGEVL